MKKEPIFTIETYHTNGYNCFYLDLMSDLSFTAFKNEKPLINSKDPNDCIKVLKKQGCVCSEDYNYKHLI